jgi:hypothetical protein
LAVTQLIEIWKNPTLVQGIANESQIIQNAAGIHDFAAKLLSARTTPEFPQFDDHLNLIATGKLRTTLSQITKNDPTDDASRKLAELYIACLAVHCGEDIRIDHPTNAKGDNPDILLSYGGNPWALAIKTPSWPGQGQTLFENIEKAAEQIERSTADRGIVVLNVKNIIDHQKLWDGQFSTLEQAKDALKDEIAKVCDAADRDRPAEDWDGVFAGKKTVLPVLLMGQSVVLLPTAASDRTPTPLKMMVACGFDRPLDHEGVETCSVLDPLDANYFAWRAGTTAELAQRHKRYTSWTTRTGLRRHRRSPHHDVGFLVENR